jgi:hypothetical protein
MALNEQRDAYLLPIRQYLQLALHISIKRYLILKNELIHNVKYLAMKDWENMPLF